MKLNTNPEIPKTLILDFGNVLTENQNKNAYHSLLQQLGVKPQEFFPAWSSHRLDYDKGLLDTQQYWAKVLSDLSVPQAMDLAAQNWEHYLETDIASFNYPREELASLTRECIDAGIKTAILSNMPPKVGILWDQLWPWLETIPVRIWSGDVGMIKPHPDIYLLAEEKTGSQPEDILFVDDLSANIAGAAQRGWRTLHFIDAPQGIREIRTWAFS